MKKSVCALLSILFSVQLASGADAVARFSLDNTDTVSDLHAVGDRVALELSTLWAGSSVQLFANGKAVRTLEEGRETYLYDLPDLGRWGVAKLRLESGELVYERQFQVLSGTIDSSDNDKRSFSLDSRTGEVRMAKRVEDISYSSCWNEQADRSQISLNGKEVFAAGECESGVYQWKPRRKPESPYVLTHFDGVETLTALFDYLPPGLLIRLR